MGAFLGVSFLLGPHGASKTDTVAVHYEGRLIDGTVFDSSVARGQPAVFQLVIRPVAHSSRADCSTRARAASPSTC